MQVREVRLLSPPSVRKEVNRPVRRTGGRGLVAIAALAAVVAAVDLDAQGPEPPALPGDTTVEVLGSGNIELHVSNMPLRTVLRMLSVQGQRNIIATPAVRGTVSADLYDVPFETALDVILSANDCAYRLRDDFIYIYTKKELARRAASGLPVTARVFTLNYVTAADIEPVITPLLSKDGRVASSPTSQVGIATSAENAGGNSLAGNDFVVVYDYPDRLEEIAHIIKQIDIRPKQVLVEATILRARLNDDNALGIDFTLLGGVDLELLGGTSLGVQNVNLGALPQDRFERFNSAASTDFSSNVPNGGLTIGIIKDHVAVFIRALEEVTDVSVLANPKILALNKQVGNVIVGRRDGYITTTVTETQAIQKVEFLETGTQLTFRPFIGTDGYIRMELHPEDSTGGLTAAQLPFEQTTEVTTNIIVRDGHTILIGGL
ncbi:MAG: hypothetical protein IID39_06550, partial [Planctomycetes bacterium]|nr:hypothetical protein [Planctomycetota bacterium]